MVALSVRVICRDAFIERVVLAPAARFSATIMGASVPLRQALLSWLHDYTAGIDAPFPLPLPETPFAAKAIAAIQQIPFGKTATYQEIAVAAGSPHASRAVGNTCRSNRYPLFIPCHRVVATGGLGGYTPGTHLKEALLSFEASAIRLRSLA